MSFQAYLDNIKAKTGKTPEDFKKLAEKKGLMNPGLKAGEIVSWLKQDFGLGHGHAMAIYAVFTDAKSPVNKPEDAIEKHFDGGRSAWHKVFDTLLSKLNEFGDDVKVTPTNSYLSILRGKKKFAVVQVTAAYMDIGIKLKGAEPTERFELSGAWNTMVTHRVRITDAKQTDKELILWLSKAYEQNRK